MERNASLTCITFRLAELCEEVFNVAMEIALAILLRFKYEMRYVSSGAIDTLQTLLQKI
jgi:hypothetical protein